MVLKEVGGAEAAGQVGSGGHAQPKYYVFSLIIN